MPLTTVSTQKKRTNTDIKLFPGQTGEQVSENFLVFDGSSEVLMAP